MVSHVELDPGTRGAWTRQPARRHDGPGFEMTRVADSAAVGRRAGQAILIGTVAVGVLDILDAFVFFGLRGVAPIRILQSIASGLLGRGSFQGGMRTAALGLVLHFFIAFCIASVYFLASRRIPVLIRHPIALGAAYGLAVYATMNFVVLPLSAARSGTPAGAVLINGLLIHVFGVGLPSAFAARAGAPIADRF